MDPTQVQAMMRAAVEKMGAIDILVANAGVQNDAPIEQMTLAQWNTVVGVDLTGAFLCARQALLHLVPYGRSGEPADVARAAAWLVSDAADYAVGATRVVDGGMALYPAFAHGG